MVVMALEDSKTKYGRCISMCGTTRGPLAFPAAQITRDLWRESGFSLVEEERDGMKVIRPDYWVVRISLLGMNDKRVDDLLRAITQFCSEPAVLAHAKYTVRRINEKRKVKNDGEEKKYINIAGGAQKSVQVCNALAWVKSAGFGAFVNVVPGPLLRATDGARITHMPLQPGSTYRHLSTAVEQAYHISRAMPEKDTELDIGGHDPDKPKIGNHWARRKADQVARDNMDELEIKEEDIDDGFGWNQKQRKRKQQIHYSGKTELLKLARLTMRL